jgi:hypothetical protein
MADLDHHQGARKLRIVKVCLILVFTCLLAIAFLLLFKEQSKPPFQNDPNLIKTTIPTISTGMRNMTLFETLRGKYIELIRRHFPNPMRYTFNYAGTNSCNVHGLLNQCMEIGGMQYFIEKGVASGHVQFGFGSPVNGQQFIQGFEGALQTNEPEWYVPKNGFRHENLVLLRYGNRITLVLSKAKAQEYEEKYPKLKRQALPSSQ